MGMLMNHRCKKFALTLFLATTGPLLSAQVTQEAGSTERKPAAVAAVDDPYRTLFLVHRFDQAALSPDGKKVAWVEQVAGEEGSASGRRDIYIAEYETSRAPVRIGAGNAAAHYDEGDLAWSPDSRQLAFLSDAAEEGQAQLYIISLNGGAPRKLTGVKGFLATPKWSPDCKTIALLFTENATRAAGPLVAETLETGEIKDAFFEQRLALVDTASGTLRQISPADTYIYDYDWTPDSKSIVLTAAKGNGDNNWWTAQLFVLSATSGGMRSIYKPKLQIARPVASPDGESVAFIEGLMSDEDSVGGDVFLMPLDNGTPSNLTPARKTSASALTWISGGKLIVFENVDGESGIAKIDPGKGQIEELYRGPELLTSGFWSTSASLSRDGSVAAFARSSFAEPPEIWAGPIGGWKQVTNRNAGMKSAWGEARSLHWKSDGYDVQGWLIYPRNFDPTKKYPMVVSVHGGPSLGVQPSWPAAFEYEMGLPMEGYFLLRPNPRGSFGQGEAFTRANVKDFGYGDWRDILAGVDEALRVAPIDPQRLGLTGWSYGGYMTMWGVTQTARFRAAVAGAGIANWSSYYGENKIDQWMIPFFGKPVYDDPQMYARSAPLTFIKNVKTPTLILVGDSDGECPTPQSYEFWHALKTLGVETQLVVYEREGHMFVKPEHLRDVIRRTAAWFDDHLK
jgi:dipeptidyl aminopeptidase/acylaminoacyl peptidase